MASHQPICVIETRPFAQAHDPGMVCEAVTEHEEERVARKGAEKGSQPGLPGHEDVLMGEEAAQDRRAFTLRHASGKDGNQAVLLDEAMDEIGHCVDAPAPPDAAMRSSRRCNCSAMRWTSSRRPMICWWRSSSSFSCSAMISISALRFTS